jgi:hypothetical protein
MSGREWEGNRDGEQHQDRARVNIIALAGLVAGATVMLSMFVRAEALENLQRNLPGRIEALADWLQGRKPNTEELEPLSPLELPQ